MNKAFLIIVILSSTITYSQMNCHVKLFDSYSSTQIQLNNSIEIKNADFSIDTVNNLITIHKIRRKRLEITFGDYELYYEKINLRKFKNDTLSRQLTPMQSVINLRFEQIWNSEPLTIDTIIFENTDDLKSHILSYFKYLVNHLNILDEPCENNTYRYKMIFSKTNLLFEISAIEKLQPLYYNCDEFDKYLDKLKIIYPKFKIKELDPKTENFSIPFTLRTQ